VIQGFFKSDSGFVNGHLISKSLEIDETIEFLVDTGASRTTLLDKDVICLGLDYNKLKSYIHNFSGIGGSVETFIIEDAYFMLGEEELKMPVFAIRHDLGKLDEENRIKILRIPSILGRDVINLFKLTFDIKNKKLIMD